MAGTDYRAYIDEQMEEQRNAAEQQNQGSNLPALAGIGAAVVGAASLRNRGVRSGIRDTLAENGLPAARKATAANMQRSYRGSGLEQMVETAKASTKALDDTLDRGSPRQLFQKKDQFEQRFQDHLSRRLDESPASSAGGQPEALALDERLQQLRSSLRHSKKQYTEAIRFNDTVEQAKRDVPERHQGSVERMLAGLDDQESRLFDRPSRGAVDEMLRRYEKGGDRADALSMEFDGPGDRDSFVDGLFRALDEQASPERYMGDAEQKRLKFGTEDGTEQGWDKFRQQIMDGFMRDNEDPDDFFSKSMKEAGYKHATVRDLDEAGMMDDYGRQVANSQGERVDSRFQSKLNKMTSLDERFGDLAADPHVFKNSDGEILDARRMAKSTYDGLAGFKENFEIPYLKFNPLDLAQFGTYQSIREAPQNYRFKRGTTQTFLGGRTQTVDSVDPKHQDARVGVLSRDYTYTGGRAIDTVSGETAADDIYLSSARFGMTPRMAAGVGNIKERDTSQRGPIKRLFDVGGQENDSAYRRLSDTMNKKKNPEWAPNALRRVREGAAGTTAEQVQDFRIVHGNINKHATPMGDDTASFVDNILQDSGEDTSILGRDAMRNQEGVEQAFQRTRQRVAEKPEAARTDVDNQVLQEWDQMQRNPQAFWGGKRVRTNRMPEVPFPFQSYDPSDSRLINKSDDVHRLVDEWKIEEADRSLRRQNSTLGDAMQEGTAAGSLSDDALDDVRNLKNLGHLRKRKNVITRGPPEERDKGLDQFQADMQRNDIYRPMAASVDQFNPKVGTGPSDGPVDYFGNAEYLAVNKAKGGEHARNKYQELVDSGQHPLMAGAKAGAEVAGQPFAGRRNPDKVTTASMGSYYYAERLDSALSGMGLGLSQQNRGSMQAIMGGHVGRRLALPFAGLEMAEYGDQMTGGVISDTAINTYTQMYTDMGAATEFLGINDMQEDIAGNLPGLDRVGGWPISGAMKFASFGAIGDTRDGEELDFYWDHGEDPVRKGRWWAFGSDTPWEGGKIDRYEPNWARRQTSDYEYSDNMYGSPDEYFGNHWMPTPTNPLAPIKRFITDPDHYEEKHKDSRPYPYTGGFAELDMIPIAGPALNNTVGRILKPAEQHHDLEEANDDYLDTLADRVGGETVGGAMKMLPGGGISLLEDPFGTTDGGNFQGESSGATPIGRGDDVALGSTDAADGVSGRMLLPPEGSEGSRIQNASIATPSTYSKAELEAINAGYRGATEETEATTTTTMESLRDADTVADLTNIRQPRGVSATARDTWYSASELGGIYGFGANSLMGWDQRLNKQTWEDSSSMFGFADRFWDMELGGLGGEMSEIGRRYNPRDARANTYNPIRNEMPDWINTLSSINSLNCWEPLTAFRTTA